MKGKRRDEEEIQDRRIKIPTKPERATIPPNTPVKAMNAISTTKGPEAMKTAETSESQEKTIMGEEVNDTTKDAMRPMRQ